MKKFSIFLISLFLIVGCACSNSKASDAVEIYLNEYIGLSENVLKSINSLVDAEDLTSDQSKVYENIIKRQYQNISYTIENEAYDGDTCDVTVKITVFDLYKVQKEASLYLSNNKEEFLTNNEYDKKKYLDYKLSKMEKTNETVTYNIVLRTIKVDGKWQVEQPKDEVLQKIHGVYNYDEK